MRGKHPGLDAPGHPSRTFTGKPKLGPPACWRTGSVPAVCSSSRAVAARAFRRPLSRVGRHIRPRPHPVPRGGGGPLGGDVRRWDRHPGIGYDMTWVSGSCGYSPRPPDKRTTNSAHVLSGACDSTIAHARAVTLARMSSGRVRSAWTRRTASGYLAHPVDPQRPRGQRPRRRAGRHRRLRGARPSGATNSLGTLAAATVRLR